MGKNVVNWLAAGIVTTWLVGACVHRNPMQRPQFQAFNQNVLKAWTHPATTPEKPVKKQVAKKLKSYRY